ncbi:hypothetical protein L798_13866 [Zootermopsis nevadensis]|uniref:Uncharacterized protein n=1 Tax=Zootermopsis nevadensis TaxID=136037 RepID=A0A067QRB9_ZOONE|nr:hypothetical protein L798_13866 [Zootermopsis nevadensis]
MTQPQLAPCLIRHFIKRHHLVIYHITFYCGIHSVGHHRRNISEMSGKLSFRLTLSTADVPELEGFEDLKRTYRFEYFLISVCVYPYI